MTTICSVKCPDCRAIASNPQAPRGPLALKLIGSLLLALPNTPGATCPAEVGGGGDAACLAPSRLLWSQAEAAPCSYSHLPGATEALCPRQVICWGFCWKNREAEQRNTDLDT